jgi:Flp pilus assembly protein TadG
MMDLKSHWQRLAQHDLGVATVEFALSLVLHCALLLGVMEASLGVYAFHFTSEAAREATRYASVRGCSGVGSSACSPAQPSDIQTYVQGLVYPGINPAAMKVTTTWSAFPSGTVCSPSSSCNNPGNLVRVMVLYKFPFSVPLLPSKLWAVTSSSAMVISQ